MIYNCKIKSKEEEIEEKEYEFISHLDLDEFCEKIIKIGKEKKIEIEDFDILKCYDNSFTSTFNSIEKDLEFLKGMKNNFIKIKLKFEQNFDDQKVKKIKKN
jgi:hypothetical protein